MPPRKMKTRSGGVVTGLQGEEDTADEKPTKKPDREDAFQGKGRTLRKGSVTSKASSSRKSSTSSKPASSGTKKTTTTKKASASSSKANSPKKTTFEKKPTSRKAAAASTSSNNNAANDAKRDTVYAPCPDDTAPEPNIYGELVMPSTANQRLQQAIIFLSDEGPENYPRFKDKLKVLEHEIGTVWPAKKKRKDDPYYQYDEDLHRKCVAMMRVQRAKVDAGYRVWFEKSMFPAYPPSESGESEEYPLPPPPPPPPRGRGRGRGGDDDDDDDDGGDSPRRGGCGGASKGGDKGKAKDAPKSYVDKDGNVVHTLSAEEIKQYEQDPWWEPMPKEEIWYKNMPAFFPFGDTAASEEHMSKRVSRDLGEDIDSTSWLRKLFDRTLGFITMAPDLPSADAWALPYVGDEQVQAYMDERRAANIKKAEEAKKARQQAQQQAQQQAAKGTKRKAGPAAASASAATPRVSARAAGKRPRVEEVDEMDADAYDYEDEIDWHA